MKKHKDYALILASGGIDSTACIAFYKNLNFKIDLIFIDYGQIAKDKEIIAIQKVAKYYNLQVKKITLKNNRKFKDGLIPGRNAMLYFIALNNFKRNNGLIVSGIHFGTPYYDCSPGFIDDLQKIFTSYSSDTIKLAAPFINLSKQEIYNYCKSEKVPLHLTYSCELGNIQPCISCETCKEINIIYNKSGQ